MGYDLGVDLGTTYTAAATRRDDRTEIATLGTRSPSIPSVVYLRPDGRLLVGEAASRRETVEPDRLAREFKRRMGDQTPILVGGSPLSATALTARLLAAVVSTVVAEEGGEPDHLIVTCPANWGRFKRDLLAQAVELAGTCRGDDATIVSEPEAVAAHYAAGARVEPGELVAVYDLGGGTFDAAVLVNTGDGHAVLGDPTGVDQLGGIDFDDAVLAHVAEQVAEATGGLDPDDPAVLRALVGLRRACVEAKEALSYDTEVAVPVVLPTLQTQVRLTRGEFERIIRPTLAVTLASLDRALRAAGVEARDLAAVVLAGGSSRIPLVAQLVTEELGRPVAVDLHPKHAVALGAARLGPARAGEPSAAMTVPLTVPRDADPAPSQPALPSVPGPTSAGWSRARRLAVAGLATVTAAVVGVAVVSATDPDRRAGSQEVAVAGDDRAPAREVDPGDPKATDPAPSATSSTVEAGPGSPTTTPPRSAPTRPTTATPPASPPTTAAPPASPGPPSVAPDPGRQWHDVATGACVDDLNADPRTVTSVQEVGCDTPHDYEALGVLSQASGPYPGTDPLVGAAAGWCTQVKDFVNSFRPDLTLSFAIGVPTQQEWDRGVQELGCFLGRADGAPLTGKIAA